jgi:hypothetical protein
VPAGEVNVRWIYASCLCAVFSFGCGSDHEQSPEDALIGTWGAPSVTYSSCASTFTFAPDGIYEDAFICELDSGAFGYEAIVGNYEVEGSTITLTATSSSCLNVSKEPRNVGYSIEKDQLRLFTDTGANFLNRVEDDGTAPTATILWGCFGANGSFAQRSLTRL